MSWNVKSLHHQTLQTMPPLLHPQAPKWCLNGKGHSTMWTSLEAQMTTPTAVGSPTLQVQMDVHILVSFYPEIPYPFILAFLFS